MTHSGNFKLSVQDPAAPDNIRPLVLATWIRLKIERISAFLYPGRDDLAVVTFEQDYSSSNLSNWARVV